ncbi:MAG: hypothetical protein ACTTIA_06945, partial [Candidatus Cryptobacteroides sp.]
SAEIKSIQSSSLGRKSLRLPFCGKVMATLMVKVHKVGIHKGMYPWIGLKIIFDVVMVPFVGCP